MGAGGRILTAVGTRPTLPALLPAPWIPCSSSSLLAKAIAGPAIRAGDYGDCWWSTSSTVKMGPAIPRPSPRIHTQIPKGVFSPTVLFSAYSCTPK